MIARYKKAIALTLALTFFILLGSSTMPLPAHPATAESGSAMESSDNGPQYLEREMQMGTHLQKNKILPVVLIGAAAVAGIFLLVILISKVKYNISGAWEFHNNFITSGYQDFDSKWTFIPYDTRNPVQGMYRRTVGTAVFEGTFTVMNKKDVIFYGEGYSEEYVGSFDSKTTMSGTFTLVSGARGSWKATKE